MSSGGFPQELHDELEHLLQASPLLATLGIELVGWLPGSATVKMTPTKEHANLVGSVHGAVLFALADAALEIASNSHGRVSVAIETTCHYTRPGAIDEQLTASAGEIARSRRTGSYRIDVRDPSGDLVAWYMAAALRTEQWHLGAQRWPEAWRATH